MGTANFHAPHSSAYIKLALLLLLLVWSVNFLAGRTSTSSVLPTSSLDTTSAATNDPVDVADNDLVHTTPIDVFDFPPLDSAAIQAVCAKTEWNPNLIFTCNNNGGGIGNLRNSILICVRHSIAAGAGFVLPQILLRKPDDIIDIWTNDRTDFSYIFDVQHFRDSIALSCPGMRTYATEGEVVNLANATRHELHVEDIASRPFFFARAAMVDRPELWPQDFSNWLTNTQLSPSAEHPLLIDLARSYLSYPVYSDGKAFAESFGSILKFRTDVRLLATKTLLALLALSKTHFNTSTSALPFQEHAFMGAHLRTEADARKSWGNSYPAQLTSYLRQSLDTALPLIYLTSGSLSEAANFVADAAAQHPHLTVLTKHDLLHAPEDKAALLALTWDQQALVDYLVLLRASSFAGSGTSSFSWGIALWRHVFAGQREHLNGPQPLSDEWSQVYGLYPRQYPQYDMCMWP